MNWNQKLRKWHRDFAYFYVGLLISFAISGIGLNHRHSWNPRKYVYDTIKLNIDLPKDKDSITDDFFRECLRKKNINLEFRGSKWKRGGYNLYFENAYAFVDPLSGEGQIERYRQRPIIGQMVELHKSSNKVWIWYSDIFAICIILICITGMIITKGKYGFKNRGWKLTLSGLIIPFCIWLTIHYASIL